jgi:2,5-diamino-6-(ribosylamino)-4(3H)-pyrimidinone 5'-phosphate reductase
MRPKVIVNCAMSADGKIASRLRKQVRLSDEADIARVHRLRNSCDAILVGVGTVIADDPSLLVKERYVDDVRHPLRIILDPTCRTPNGAKVLDGRAATLIVATEGNARRVEGAEVIECGVGGIDLSTLMAVLERRGIRSLLVEGGGRTIWGFVSAKLVDELKVFVSSVIIGGALAPTPVGGDGFGEEGEFASLSLVRSTVSSSGILLEFEMR